MKKYAELFKKKNSDRAYPTEPEIIEAEIQRVQAKIERSWNHFLYAQADYFDIAIMEIYCYELEYGILYNKLLQLYGRKRQIRYTDTNTRDYLPWLMDNLVNPVRKMPAYFPHPVHPVQRQDAGHGLANS
ncbi:MAG: hypothetical protein AWM53_01590 [Candidatus Dichloromethanomonas elyunquensis]|nr:MAG: hypothetical protein AWM53_01590 [Candidatus Dichloromethanomonas elyunquensis]